MSNILVTGGLGHIGSALVKKLAPDYSVTVVDNLLTQRYCSLFSFNQPVKFVEGSFRDVSLDGIDTVIHLAAITDAAQQLWEQGGDREGQRQGHSELHQEVQGLWSGPVCVSIFYERLWRVSRRGVRGRRPISEPPKSLRRIKTSN